jgi:hypothetical protein
MEQILNPLLDEEIIEVEEYGEVFILEPSTLLQLVAYENKKND